MAESGAASLARRGAFTGSSVLNPFTGRAVPVYVADYVLMGYGTGAIMAVPAEDHRDWDFAQAYGLPVVRTVRPYAHLAIRPYPEEYVTERTMKDGTPVVLRPIKPEDEPMWHELLGSCSTQSLWFRFSYLFKQTTHEMATRYCFIDYDREIGIVAEVEEEGQRRLIGGR